MIFRRVLILIAIALPALLLARAEEAGAPVPEAAEPERTAAPENPETPAPGDVPVPDGGVPADSAGFRGRITGTVETVNEKGTSFKIKVTLAEPGDGSKAGKPETLVGAVVQISHEVKKTPSGVSQPTPGHDEFISSLKPGEHREFHVRYSRKGNKLKLTAVPVPGAEAKP